MVSTVRVSLVAGAGLALLAACGPGQPARAQTSPHDQYAPVWHRLVVCARQNGMPDVADPTIDDQGRAQLPDNTPPPSAQVLRACRSIYDQLPPRVRSENIGPTRDVNQLRRFAQCMREQGITDWPDPDAGGQFPFPTSLRGNFRTGPRWPQIEAAWMGPCEKYNANADLKAMGS
jgi:hypothetical protein